MLGQDLLSTRPLKRVQLLDWYSSVYLYLWIVTTLATSYNTPFLSVLLRFRMLPRRVEAPDDVPRDEMCRSAAAAMPGMLEVFKC